MSKLDEARERLLDLLACGIDDYEVAWRGRVLEETGCVHIEYEPEDGRLEVVVFGADLSLGHDKMRELGIRLFETIAAFSKDQSDG